MPTLSVDAIDARRVTFVEAVLEADEPHRIRLEPCFDGEIWAPRSENSVVESWDRDGITLDVAAGRTPIGFATPVRPTGRILKIGRCEPLPHGLPHGIQAWIDRIDARLEDGETLSNVDDLASATEAIASVGGLEEVESLDAEIARDRRIARQLSVVPDELRSRLERVEIPSATFATIASASLP